MQEYCSSEMYKLLLIVQVSCLRVNNDFLISFLESKSSENDENQHDEQFVQLKYCTFREFEIQKSQKSLG